MKSLGKQSFRCESTSGDRKDIELKTFVNNDGEFRILIPEELWDSIEEWLIVADHPMLSHQRVNRYLHGSNLKELIRIFYKFWEDFNNETYVDEFVIHYDYRATCHYCYGSDKNIYPSGYSTPGDFYEWNETVNSGACCLFCCGACCRLCCGACCWLFCWLVPRGLP